MFFHQVSQVLKSLVPRSAWSCETDSAAGGATFRSHNLKYLFSVSLYQSITLLSRNFGLIFFCNIASVHWRFWEFVSSKLSSVCSTGLLHEPTLAMSWSPCLAGRLRLRQHVLFLFSFSLSPLPRQCSLGAPAPGPRTCAYHRTCRSFQ